MRGERRRTRRARTAPRRRWAGGARSVCAVPTRTSVLVPRCAVSLSGGGRAATGEEAEAQQGQAQEEGVEEGVEEQQTQEQKEEDGASVARVVKLVVRL
jgi:hypothetical protein